MMPLAACTATSDADPRASSDPVSSSVTTSSPVTTVPTEPVDSGQSGTETMSAPPIKTSPFSTPTTSESTAPASDAYEAIPVEIPATITGAALDAANAAIPVWRNAVRLYDESMQDPSDDWTAKLRKYVGDPAAITQLSLLASFAKDGVHQIGAIDYEGAITHATAHNVEIRACVDISNFDVVNSAGDSVMEPNTPGRFYREYNIDFYPDAGHVWLLNLITTAKPAQTC
ncbi:MAG: hypothetical protein J0I11_14385 [Actinobacteria bacterium]|nr:hypothetical protein [Actinomycetota bacterium]